ncbi:MAG: hypothetical protein ACK559_17900, partial [bacterium]
MRDSPEVPARRDFVREHDAEIGAGPPRRHDAFDLDAEGELVFSGERLCVGANRSSDAGSTWCADDRGDVADHSFDQEASHVRSADALVE